MPDQAVGAGEGALSGAASGAAIGSVVPGVGTLIGAGVGALAGGALGYFSSDNKGYSLPTDLYNQRLSQIANYSSQLQGATSQYATAIGNMYNTAYSQYVPNAAAALGSRGLDINSGAFGAELGRAAAQYSSEDMTNVAKMNISSIDKVNDQYGNAWADMFGAAEGSNKAGFQQSNANVAGLLGTAAGVGRLGLNSMNNKPTANPWSDHPQANGYAGFGEGDTDLAGNPWGF